MASMTDYMVLQGKSVDLGFGTDNYIKSLDFTLESDFTVGTQYARPIFAYIARPSGDSSFNLYVNPIAHGNIPPGGNILDYNEALSWSSFSGDDNFDHALWQAISGKLLHPGDNRIYVRVTKGKIRFRDIVLWFQRGKGD